MKFTIDKNVFDLFPEVVIGVLVGHIHSKNDSIRGNIDDYRKHAHGKVSTIEQDQPLKDHPNVSGWHDTYKAFGAKPKKYKPTHEAMAKRVLKDNFWPNINDIVDIYLTNQVYHILPHGGYDLDTLSGDLTLEVSSGNESFEPLGGGEELTESGEVIYKDSSIVLTRRWNYKDADKTKITNETKNFILMIESASPSIKKEDIEAAVEDLKSRYSQNYEGEFETKFIVATKETNEFDL